ncbi:MAG: alanyl-tRNA editing protein AlaX [Desulfurococcales archaeon ex4484_58]|nr:MAG: alanyl-tRNA editing protein AlaX [Desulfurococcales archaeon ex4484_58]
MMVELVYQRDSYIRELVAKITSIEDNKVFVDKTIFHPRSGGVDHDTGFIVSSDGRRYRVVKVYFEHKRKDVVHELEEKPELSIGDEVKLVIDWDRRYRLMRLHTAAHILAAIMYNEYGALITGGNISVDKAYDDYALEVFNKQIFIDVVNKANEIVSRNIEVKIYWLPREKALKIPGLVKLASRMPPDIGMLRIVEIPGVDIQADGGPHVRNTSEIGRIEIIDIVNKGKKRKRLYYTVKP